MKLANLGIEKLEQRIAPGGLTLPIGGVTIPPLSGGGCGGTNGSGTGSNASTGSGGSKGSTGTKESR